MRYHVEVHASHRGQMWEPPSASLIERDPEVIPDVDIAAKVGKDLFLDEKIPRHEFLLEIRGARRTFISFYTSKTASTGAQRTTRLICLIPVLFLLLLPTPSYHYHKTI
jgi:hypothetical protein